MPSSVLSRWTKSMQFAGKCNDSTLVSTGVDGLTGKTTLASLQTAPAPRIRARLCGSRAVENHHLRPAAPRLYWLPDAVRPGGASFFFLDS
jgi:hypothetical protein